MNNFCKKILLIYIINPLISRLSLIKDSNRYKTTVFTRCLDIKGNIKININKLINNF